MAMCLGRRGIAPVSLHEYESVMRLHLIHSLTLAVLALVIAVAPFVA